MDHHHHGNNDGEYRRSRGNQERESKEDRLLRRAREFVEKMETKRHKRDDDKHRKKGRRYDEQQDGNRRRESKGRRRDQAYKRKRNFEEDEEDSVNIGDEDRRRHHRKRSKKKERRKETSKSRKTDRRHDKKRPKHELLIDRSRLMGLGSKRGRSPEKLLSVAEDYFAFHQHLWVYLYREESLAFSDLSSDEARDAFKRFVQQYNRGDLEEGYYQAVMPAEVLEECQTTRHKWSFHTTESEKKSLHLIEVGVRKQTEYDASTSKSAANITKAAARPESDNHIVDEDTRGKWSTDKRLERRRADRRLREHIRTAEEEMTGGKREGRERQIELKREKASRIHGAMRDRQGDVGIELNDSDLYDNGGDSDFKRALAREKRQKLRREEQRAGRISELKQKERDRQEAMLKSLGLSDLQPGEKITIRPRDPP